MSVEYACLGVTVSFGSHISGFGAVTAVLIVMRTFVVFEQLIVSISRFSTVRRGRRRGLTV